MGRKRPQDLAGDDHEGIRQAPGRSIDHDALFISRPASEEPDSDRPVATNAGNGSKLPLFLGDEDQDVSVQDSDTGSSPPEPAVPAQSKVSHRKLAKDSPYIIGKPTRPKETWKKFHTNFYERYDKNLKNVGPPAEKFKMNLKIWNNYTLVVDPTMLLSELPRKGVRVDDYIAGKLLMSDHSNDELYGYWPGEFDQEGMIRAMRIPLGHASKTWREVGERGIDVDSDGNRKAVKQGQQGWYYDWWRGLHCLMGKEGNDAEMYWTRPSHEEFKCEGMTFKTDCKAVVQLPTGDPNDPTPGLKLRSRTTRR
ncbi:MAG: hypothetical protein Q9169_004517 [Polycauliona sp. 2 TL-2023]